MNKNKNQKNYEVIFDISNKENKVSQLKKETEKDGFWNDQKNAQSILQEIKKLEIWIDQFDTLFEKQKNIFEFNA